MQYTIDDSMDDCDQYVGLRPLFAYYGGKQTIANKILSLLPKHNCYVEPFCGGAALFWAKGTKRTDNYTEILNDTNGLIVNLFNVLRTEALRNQFLQQINLLPYARKEHEYYKLLITDDPVTMAVQYYYLINASYANKYASGFNTGAGQNKAYKYHNRLMVLNRDMALYVDRLLNVIVENLDAIICINKYDSEHTLFYIDPPYVNTDQGHYNGYTNEHYIHLLDCLRSIKGKFILSGYPNEYVPKEWVYYDIPVKINILRHRKDIDGHRIEKVWVNF